MSAMELEGMEEVFAKIDELGKKANRCVNAALKAGAEPILQDAITNAPERTGKGKKGLKVGGIKTLKGTKYVEIGLTKGDISKIFYLKFHEFGTSKMKARPFLQPALEKNKRVAQQIIANELKKGLGI